MKVFNPGLGGSGGGSSSDISREELEAAANGQAFLHDGVFVSHIPRGVYPIFITNPSGKQGAPRYVSAPATQMGPIWFPDADYAPQRVNGNAAGDQWIRMSPYRRYVVTDIDIVNVVGTPGALTFGVYSNTGGAGGGGIEVLPTTTTLSGMTSDLRSRKTFANLNGGLGIDLEADHLYLNVVTPNASPISFVMMFHGRALMPCDE
ncbi:hypothetical protein [Methylopila sp. Yamaguchi]|uniref:hypothetical protein n=1 Tax=Methylopila sp. Yamaguchi TaxID=1437817 RepID=UPI000CA9378A|nr:hypothetical protein [Methylopila sp. Yamaguchi]GBD48112.1 hypothetical protein METY_1325 [Methylopila sp. Yamaguchi]